MSLARRTLQVTAFICTLVVGAASMAVIVTQTTWFKDWLRGFIVRQAEGYVNGRLSIGRLDGNLFFGVELEDVDVTMKGQKVVDLKDVGIDYNFWTFISGNVVLDDIRLNKAVIRLEKDAEGWNLMRLVKARTPDRPRNRRPLEIREIGISDAMLYVQDWPASVEAKAGTPASAKATAGKPVGTSGVTVPRVIDKIDASVGVKTDEDLLEIDIKHVSLRAREPHFGVNSLSGRILRTKDSLRFENVALRTEESSLSVNGSVTDLRSLSASHEGRRSPMVDLRASSDKFALDELAAIVPALRNYPFQPAFTVTARGRADRLDVTLEAREQVLGEMNGTLLVDAAAPGRTVEGDVALRHFNVGPLVRQPRADSDIVGTAHVDLALPEQRDERNGSSRSGKQTHLPLRGTYSVDFARVSIGGYEARNVRASGRIDDRIVRVRGRAAGYGGHATADGVVKLGAPLRLDLAGAATHVDMRHTPPQLKVPGVPSDLDFSYTLSARGSVYSGQLQLETSTLADATIAKGTTVDFQLGGGAPSYSATGSVTGLDAQQIGRGFAITLLQQDRFKSRVNGTFTVKGSGGGRYPLNLDASGELTDSELFGAGVPRMDFATQFHEGDAHVRAIGTFSGLNPEIPSGNRRYEGSVTGAIDVDTTIRNYADGVTIDNLDAQGRVNLGRSTVGRFTIDTAVVDGRYAGREGEINQLTVTGPDLNATAQGTIALNDTGSSNLTAHVESPSIDRLGEMIGQPLTGSAIVDADVTGNGRSLKAVGTLKGSNVGRGESNALNLDSQFTAEVPNLEWSEATVEAKSHATFVQIAGQKINELTADTTYRSSNLEFNATAKEGVRELSASGSALLHPDHREVHLGNMAFRTQGVVWQSEPDSTATIQYGSNRVALQNVRLVSGTQRVEANGVIGSTRETLAVRAENVDIAQLDQLLLLNHGMTGTLNADAKVSGSLKEPHVDGTFALNQGAFRQFTFDSFGGKVAYAGTGVTVDVRLQQTPSAWLTATGYAPLAMFRFTEEPGHDHDAHGHEASAPGEGVDLKIASSQIDLGVVQGFTSYVTNVTGALQANVTVTGSAHDPHMNGAIDIRGGAFTVPELGTAYTGLDTRIDLLPDQVKVSEMRILDQHKHVMTVGGSLAVHEREVGGVDIQITSDEFEVIDNRLADLKVGTRLHVTGDIKKPRLEGSVELKYGTINVTDVVERATASPYATEETDIEKLEPATPTLLDALDLNLGIAVPSSLVLKGNDIRTANAPIGIGDVNLTVGGAVQLRKAPGQKMRLIGEVNTVRGNYTFQGRRFDIQRDGRIRFGGTEEINPVIDLKARRIIAGIETFVLVRGTLAAPELSFTSTPPLEEADILSLIVFNQPINQLGEGQQVNLAQQAGALAGGYLTGGLTRSIGDALELDEFELQAAGDLGLGPSLTVGEQVGERLFVKLRQGFGAEQATEFLLEYQLKDYLRFQGSLAETAGGTQRAMFRRVERGGLDLIFFFSY